MKEARCAGDIWDAGHIWDKSWPRQGRNMIFWNFSTVSGHCVQAMSRMHPGRDRDVTYFSSISRQSLGHDVQAISRTCPSHGMDGAWFSSILGLFLGTMCRPCPGRILIAVGTLPDFQVFLGSFWGTVCRPCLGRVLIAVGTQPDFQAMSRIQQGRNLIFKQFLGSSVQAMSRMRLGRDKEAA
ncbi:Hypothetical predicted protein [Olea europaea subsp. europaea]|uniref:Uncharacterized protein n=1 Tax=Olea europaea subsp. europaea TaxID=158383 RepID=A0A8S0TYU1_OLEEU|nr:Hypothetical predicted protein [Olea europaea subsp. europaea]